MAIPFGPAGFGVHDRQQSELPQRIERIEGGPLPVPDPEAEEDAPAPPNEAGEPVVPPAEAPPVVAPPPGPASIEIE